MRRILGAAPCGAVRSTAVRSRSRSRALRRCGAAALRAASRSGGRRGAGAPAAAAGPRRPPVEGGARAGGPESAQWAMAGAAPRLDHGRHREAADGGQHGRLAHAAQCSGSPAPSRGAQRGPHGVMCARRRRRSTAGGRALRLRLVRFQPRSACRTCRARARKRGRGIRIGRPRAVTATAAVRVARREWGMMPSACTPAQPR